MSSLPHIFLAIGLVLSACDGGDQSVIVKPGEASIKAEAEVARPLSKAIQNEFALSDEELSTASQRGARGSKEDAMRVAMYYMFGIDDEDKAVYWFQIAAENGDPGAMQNLSVILHSRGGAENCERSKYWLNRIKTSFDVSIVQSLNVDIWLKSFEENGCPVKANN